MRRTILLALFGTLLVGVQLPHAEAAGSRWAEAPKKCLGVIVGAVVGTPIAAVRCPIKEEKHGVDNMDGDCHKARVRIPTAILWLPFAIAAGAFEAPWIAMGNSVLNYDKPFSKGQFSIVDTPEEQIAPNADTNLERREHESQ